MVKDSEAGRQRSSEAGWHRFSSGDRPAWRPRGVEERVTPSLGRFTTAGTEEHGGGERERERERGEG